MNHERPGSRHRDVSPLWNGLYVALRRENSPLRCRPGWQAQTVIDQFDRAYGATAMKDRHGRETEQLGEGGKPGWKYVADPRGMSEWSVARIKGNKRVFVQKAYSLDHARTIMRADG